MHAEDRSGQWLDRFRHSHAQCSWRDHDPAFGPVFVRGAGARIWDTSGKDWFDLTCGFSASNFGHAYPPLVEIAQKQLTQLTHLTGEPHVARIELAEKLCELLAEDWQSVKVVFNASGARAVESAWKAACAFRPGRLLTLAPGFHGRTIATAACSDTRRSALSGPIESEVVVWPADQYPYCARCPLGLRFPSCSLRCEDALLRFIESENRRISAVLVEPALGARGYVFPPPDFFLELRRVTAKHGVLLIADEIQTGLGRCGKWLVSSAHGWQPDLVVLGKSLGGGIAPISAVIGRAEVLDSIPAGAESETFAATPLACRVAMGVLSQLEEESLLERAEVLGGTLRRVVHQQAQHERLSHRMGLEGVGAVCAIEMIGNPQQPGSHAEYAAVLANCCRDQRLRIHRSGPVESRIVLLPPLTMTDSELGEAAARLTAAIHAWAGQIADQTELN